MQDSIKSESTQDFIEVLTKLCESYSSKGYYVKEQIPEDKLANARSAFKIPEIEAVIALIDATAFSGKADRGLAVGANGIYWYNDYHSSQAKNIGRSLNWRQFSTTSVRYKKENILEIGEGNAFYIYNSVLDGRVPKLLLEIQSLVKDSQYTLPSIEQNINVSHEQQATSIISNPSPEFVDALKKICASYSSNDYYVEELIPVKQLTNACSAFPIPQSEKVVALLDTTAWKKGDCGLVIGVHGIYWRNVWGLGKTIKTNLEWDEFAKASIRHKPEDKSYIEIGEGNEFYARSSSLNGKTLELLLEIQSLVKNGSTLQLLSEEWFIVSSNQQFGPYNISTIDIMIASDQIVVDECLSWKEGMEDWLPFKEVPELRALIQAPQPRVTPTPPPIAAKPTPPPIPSKNLESLKDVFSTSLPNLRKSDERVETERIDLNNASFDELLTLPGINRTDAKELIRERDSRIGFETVEQVGHFLELQPHQVEKLKKKTILKPCKSRGSRPVTSARNRVIDF